MSINDLVGTIKGDAPVDGPPIYRIKPAPFGEFLKDYERHVRACEAYSRKGRTRVLAAAIVRGGFLQRYAKVLPLLFRPVMSMGQFHPFMNTSLFRHPKANRDLLWKLARLAEREWRVETRSGEGRTQGKAAKTAERHRQAEKEYRREFARNPYETHPGVCRQIAVGLRGEGWRIHAATLENLLRALGKSLRKKRKR